MYTLLTVCSASTHAEEQQSGVWGKGARWEHGEVKDDGTELTGSTRVKLVRHGVARYVVHTLAVD